MEALVVLLGRRGVRLGLSAMCAAVLAVAPAAEGAVIPVGSGPNTASVHLEFMDGASFVFEVAFDGTVSGMGLLDIIEANSTLTTVRKDFGWGEFVDGFSFEGHANAGYGGGEEWWHYWVMNPGTEWASPAYGAAMREVIDGCSDGWVYGRAGVPTPEPASAMLACVAGGLVLRRSRRLR